MDLNIIWFVLVGVLFIGYSILDGFDFGVGALHLLTRTDRDRRILLNSIGPVWDGNEVWLVTGGGALFAAFPNVYATVFSGFYLAFMLLLFALIFRAVAIEFRSKQASPAWRSAWDVSFSISSILAPLLIGVALGNLAWGVPLNAAGDFTGNFFTLLHPYTLLMGVLAVALFTMHGAIYLLLKTEGDLYQQAKVWARNSTNLFIVLYLITTAVTVAFVPQMTTKLKAHPLLTLVPVLNILAVFGIIVNLKKGNEIRAFQSSCLTIATQLMLFGINIFPYMVYSNPHPEFSLTIYNAASSQKTLKIMLVIAALGVPLVLAYTSTIYWIFRGKVKLDSTSY